MSMNASLTLEAVTIYALGDLFNFAIIIITVRTLSASGYKHIGLYYTHLAFCFKSIDVCVWVKIGQSSYLHICLSLCCCGLRKKN